MKPEEQLQSFQGISRAVLEATLVKLVENGAVSAETVNGTIDQIRSVTHEKVSNASEIGSSLEQGELLEKFLGQYVAMRQTLEYYEISTKFMPTWESIVRDLTSDVLEKALKLSDPTLLLVPPTSCRSKINAIDKYPVECQRYDTFTFDPKNLDLWSYGKYETENEWRVLVVEGVQDVAQDEQIYNGDRTNKEMSELWIKKYEAQGLDVIDDIDTYLTLMMKALAEGKPVDLHTFTVLNGKNITEFSEVVGGNWIDDRVALDFDEPDLINPALRLRGLVVIDISKAA